MFTVERREEALPLIELSDGVAGSRALLAPTRGGLCTSLVLGGREVFYLDPATLADPTANVRGGAPVLFPSPGKLTGDAWQRDEHKGSMRQHGFARNLAWEVGASDTSEAASQKLILRSTEDTRARYPWDFTAEYDYRLAESKLHIEMCFQNHGDLAMPFGAGFHPYFAVTQEEKATAVVETAATRVFDNAQKRELPFTGIDLTAAEVDYHLLDHGSSSSSLSIPSAGEVVHVRGSSDFTHWVVWTLGGKDFVCVEPWTCPGDALNSGDRLLWIAPGGEISMWLEIERETR